MTVNEIAFKIEELQVEAEKVDGLQKTLFAAVYEGNYALEEFEWVFVLLGQLTHALKKELDEVTKELFDIIRAKGKEVA